MSGFLAFAETWTVCQQHATNGYLLIPATTKSLKGRLSKLRDVLRECYIRHSCLGHKNGQ